MMYRRVPFLSFVMLMLVISGCSSLGGVDLLPDSGNEQDTTGEGLEVSFSLSTQNVRAQQVRYSLTLRNSGEQPIELRPGDNMVLKTLERSNENSFVFTRDSIQRNLYENILDGSDSLTLYQNQEVGPITGTLQIADWYWEKETVDDFSYRFVTQYPYETSFSNTVEINRAEGSIRVRDLSQGAPVQVTDIELQPHPESEYYINYFIRDRGPGARDSSSVSIQEMEVSLGTEPLGNCDMFKQNEENAFEPVERPLLDRDTRELVYSCQVNLDRFSENRVETSKTAGSFTYTYTVQTSGSVSLPDNRDAPRFG